MSRRWTKAKPPNGFDVIEPVLDALENEMRDKVKESNAGKRNTESVWPVHQINWQRSRYVYDMYYTYHRITRQVYDYCIKQKLIDAALIAKWKKPGYERLCSTYVINPANFKFGTTSICRVPLKDRAPHQQNAQDPTTGCFGCASGSGGRKNIFGNKYGQNLAAVQIAREKRMEAAAEKRKLQQQQQQQELKQQQHDNDAGESETDSGGESETDDDDDDDDDDDEDWGPTPAAGVWAGSDKLQKESEAIAAEEEEEEEYHGNNNNNDDVDSSQKEEEKPSKKQRLS